MPRRPKPRQTPGISQADRHRYNLFRDGVSPAEIATRDRVTVSQVERSVLRCREERQRYSQEAVEVAVRRTVLERLPQSSEAISGALTATRKERIAVVVTDPETGEAIQMENSVDVPDHKTRLSGHSALIELISSIKANVPLSQVNVDNRSQTNNLLGLPAHASGPSSAEAVIREIRAARGLALTDGAVVEGNANPIALAEVDVELAEELEDDPEEDEEDSEEEQDLEPNGLEREEDDE